MLYMILSELSFALFFTNLVFLLSIGQGYGDWYMKSFPVVVGLTSFTFCLDLYNNSIRK
jgi:uncharacterized membrane protein